MPRVRYSYTWQNAVRFLPAYDNLIHLYQSPGEGSAKVFVKCDAFPGIHVPSSLQNRIVDGLKYIADKFNEIPDEFLPAIKYKHSDYSLLKINLRTETRFNPPGVMMSLKILSSTGMVVYKTAGVSNTNSPVSVQVEEAESINHFRTSVEQFLEDPMRSVHQFKNLSLTDGDRSWINNLLATTPMLISHWDKNNLTIVKEK